MSRMKQWWCEKHGWTGFFEDIPNHRRVDKCWEALKLIEINEEDDDQMDYEYQHDIARSLR